MTAMPASATYDQMPSSLPDDSYTLFDKDNGKAITDSYDLSNCDGSGGSGSGHGCTAGSNPSAGGTTHQYLTISKGSVNDDNGPGKYGGFIAKKIEIEIYTKSKGNKSLSFSMVSRSIGTQRGCQGYKIGVGYMTGSQLALYETAPGVFSTTPSGQLLTDSITPQPYSGSCLHTYPLHYFPSAGFTEIYYPDGTPSGVYKGIIQFTLPSNTPDEKQASFNVYTSGAKLAYKGTTYPDNDPSYSGFGSSSIKDGWVNTYPTNAADGHQVKFRFSPPCGTAQNSEFYIAWDDVDQANSYQPSSAGPVVLKVYKEHRDGSNRSLIYTKTFNQQIEATFSKGFNTQNYDSGTIPFAYTAEFSNVYGGNGITFRYPYSSANFFLDCKPVSKWHLTPSTGIQKQTDPFNSTGTQTRVRSSAKQAFGAARFSHYLQETLRQTKANDGDHKWVIKYRYKRNGGVWRTNTTTNDSNGEERPWGSDCKAGNFCSIAVPAGGRVAIKNNSIPGGTLDQVIANLKYIFTKDDGAKRTPQTGDTYCEELVNRYVKPGNSADSQSGWQCVSLSANPPCPAWTVGGIKSVTGNPANGGDQNAAWVGDNYNYNYYFYNAGPADNTKNINFFPSAGATHSQVFGSPWAPSYPQSISRSQGGQLLTNSMLYAPIKSAGPDNCGQEGNNTLTNSIYVPYYYHMTSTSTLPGGPRSEQGDVITAKLTVNLPPVDTGGSHTGDASSDSQYGRKHTHSVPTSWRILEFKTTQGKTPESSFPKNKSGNGTCAEIQALIVDMTPGSCSPVASGNQVFEQTDTQLEYPRTAQLDPIGTKICYVGAVDRPVEQDNNPAVDPGSPASRYSDVSSTTIVKSPKVQFTNGDLAVGRSRLGDGGSETACSPLKLDAPIIATGAPSFVQGKPATYPQPTLYGSWVEYGAFAPGNISGFGSAAYSAPNTYKKLTFANTPSTGGYDNYGTQCMNNPFNLVKEPDVNNIDAEADNLTMDTYFSDAAHDTSAKDKTGYVATSKNIAITGTLGDNYDAFRGRDIVIHAKKHAGACGSDAPGDTVGGNITIKNNITYMKSGYGDLTQLPRIILLADCKIIINDGVTNVDAWLVAKDAVQTCSTATGMKFFPDRNVTQGDCAAQLKINGPVQAKRLLLWRTYGSDLQADDPANIAKAAEVFDLRPDQLLATYARGRDAGKPQTVYQTDLPPLY